MICPECGEENQDSAKFCKKCGTSLTPISTNNVNLDNQSKTIKSGVFDNSNSNSQSSFGSSNSGGDNKNLIIICLTIIICAVLIAGGLIFLSNNGSSDNGSSDSISLADDNINQSEDSASVENAAQSSQSNMKILSGSFSTGGGLNDKTYCSVYVGEEYAGEDVKISVLYSRDGSNLNQGNIVPKTVGSDGYISVPSADAFKYFPDNAFITIYDANGNVLDTQEVNMEPKKGKQTFS